MSYQRCAFCTIHLKIFTCNTHRDIATYTHYICVMYVTFFTSEHASGQHIATSCQHLKLQILGKFWKGCPAQNHHATARSTGRREKLVAEHHCLPRVCVHLNKVSKVARARARGVACFPPNNHHATGSVDKAKVVPVKVGQGGMWIDGAILRHLHHCPIGPGHKSLISHCHSFTLCHWY